MVLNREAVDALRAGRTERRGDHLGVQVAASDLTQLVERDEQE